MMEKENLAMEMLRELKQNSRRWFIIAIIELVLLVGSNIAWLVYQSQYETVSDETTTEYSQEADTDGNNSPINQNMGEWYKWLMQDKQKE